jgi:DNA polymerase III subunit alpha
MLKGINPGKLLAVKNNRTWDTFEEPSVILKSERIRGFVENECLPFCAPTTDWQYGLNRFVMDLARKYDDPVTIGDDAHFGYVSSKEAQTVKLNTMGDNFKFYGSYHLYSADEAYACFKDTLNMSESEFERILENNAQWADRFKDFKFDFKPSLPASFYPQDTLTEVKNLIKKHGRMNWKDRAMMDRLKQEIELFKNNGTLDLLPYFFLAEEAADQYRQKKLLTGVARGSAGGVLLAYLLSITHLNPLKYNLSLDRFLTLDRIASGKLPDIDSDFIQREIITEWLDRRFPGHWAQMSTDGLMRIKLAIKEVSRIYNNDSVPWEVEELCKKIPATPMGIEDINYLYGYTQDDGKEVKGLLEEHPALKKYSEDNPEQWELVKKVLGLRKSHGRHASGLCISDKPIDEIVPLMSVSKVRVTQPTMEGCEASGLVKMDFLGLNTLNDIDQCIKIIQESHPIKEEYLVLNGVAVPGYRAIPFKGHYYDIWDLPPERPVFNDICEGRSETVFQVSTPSALKWMKSFNYHKPKSEAKLIDSIDEIAIFTALDRPGPLDAMVTDPEDNTTRNMLQEYASRAMGRKPIGNIPYLDKYIPETHGVIVFQEQLQRIYQDLTGCSGIDANKFRDDISKKRMEKVLSRYGLFMENACKKMPKEEAEAIWNQIFTCGNYLFNQSHAVAYAIIAYASAFLKHFYPLEWWCGVLRNATKDDISEKFWKYCKNLVVMPDIKYSTEDFSIKNGKIYAPIRMLQGVGEGAHNELIAGMPYKDIDDFCQKIAQTKSNKSQVNDQGKVKAGLSALNSGIVSKLIISGVMDSLFPEGLDIITKLETYQAALARALNKKKPEKVDPKYIPGNSLIAYQQQKSILPVYSEFLAPTMFNAGIHGVSRVVKKLNNGESLDMYSYLPEDRDIIRDIIKQMDVSEFNHTKIPFLNGQIFRTLNKEASINGTLRCAVAAYVLNFKSFDYTDKKTEKRVTAHKFVLDIDGEIVEILKWPSRNNRLNWIPTEQLEGSIIVAMISKYKETAPFNMDAFIMAQENTTIVKK